MYLCSYHLLSGKFLGITLDNEMFGAKTNTSARSVTFHKSLRKASVMETNQVSQQSQVKDGPQVKPQEAPANVPLAVNLETSFKSALEDIRHCDEQANLWLERKKQLQTKVNDTLSAIQKQVSGSEEKPKKKEKVAPTRTRVNKDATVPELIRSYLEKNGPKRTRDIRKFLLGHGRKTSPGVALSRMLKGGDLKQSGRGVYNIA